MKKLLLPLLIFVFSAIHLKAQQFISINPDFGQSNQTISTIVTSSNFYFTQGSVPSVWGDFYMIQGNQQILPTNVSVIDDDHLNVTWFIPLGVPNGNYVVQWNLDMVNIFYDVPGGFNIDCVPPAAQISNPTTTYFCNNGGSVTLQANTGTGFTYEWYRNNVLVASSALSSYVATLGGTYNVKVSNAQGCARYSSDVYVYPINPPGATVVSPTSNTSICPGSNIVLTANGGSGLTYQWLKNGVQINGATISMYSTSDTGSYTVRVTNSSGCSSVSTARIISEAPLPPSYVTANGPLTFCAGNSVKLKTSSGTGYSYQWYKFGNPIAGANSQNLIVSTTGAYKVMVTNSYGCTKKSGNTNVTVLNSPTATITPAGSTSICAGDSVKLNANNGSGYTYYWKRYGVPVSGATASSFMAKNGGVYKVVVTNSSGCSKISSPVTVSIVCREGFLSENSENEIDIYPNPARYVLSVTGNEIDRIEIISTEGKVVKSIVNNYENNIDISELHSGLYSVVIHSKNNTVTRRFVKE